MSVRSRTIDILQAGMNLLIVLLFALLAISSFHRYVESRSLQAFGILAVNTLFLGLFLARRPAQDETRSAVLWALSFAGTAVPLLLRPAAHGHGAYIGPMLELVGTVMLVAALLSLRRSFAVVPGNRGIQHGGMYRLVRHPVYLAELTLFLGLVLANPTLRNAVIWACECILEIARARAEERFLAADPAYEAYRARVRYRLIPWVA